MYFLARLFLLAMFLEIGACLAVIIFATAPLSVYILIALALRTFFRRRPAKHWEHGTARVCGMDDVEAAGMVDSGRGLMLGRLIHTSRWSLSQSLGLLLGFVLAGGKPSNQVLSILLLGQIRKPLIWLNVPCHACIVAPTGTGKDTRIITPFLQTCRDSVWIFDPKGEAVSLTADYRAKKLGQTVKVFDPFGATAYASEHFNPLDFIDTQSPLALDHIRALADAIVVRQENSKDPHWDEMAVVVITVIIGAVVFHAPPELRNLQTFRDILADSRRFELAVNAVCQSSACGGLLARIGNQLRHLQDREYGSVMSAANRHASFLDSEMIARCMATSTFDPARLSDGNMTIFFVIPPELLRTTTGLMRLMITAAMHGIVKGGVQERNKIHFVLNEAASIGHLAVLDDCIDKYRSYGIRLQLYLQSISQAQKLFPEGQHVTALANMTQVLFGVNDWETAEYVANRMGDETIVVASGGNDRSFSLSNSDGQSSASVSKSRSANDGWSLMGRKLLRPEEVLDLPAGAAITFMRGIPPLLTALVPYYSAEWRTRYSPFMDAARCLAACVALALIGTYPAALMAPYMRAAYAISMSRLERSGYVQPEIQRRVQSTAKRPEPVRKLLVRPRQNRGANGYPGSLGVGKRPVSR